MHAIQPRNHSPVDSVAEALLAKNFRRRYYHHHPRQPRNLKIRKIDNSKIMNVLVTLKLFLIFDLSIFCMQKRTLIPIKWILYNCIYLVNIFRIQMFIYIYNIDNIIYNNWKENKYRSTNLEVWLYVTNM